ncbi:MAG: hypothetical protein J6C81_05555 [Muribaculaceae bacterium]|nr:hypothetical protein [Muribaculaceae bacterium]
MTNRLPQLLINIGTVRHRRTFTGSGRDGVLTRYPSVHVPRQDIALVIAGLIIVNAIIIST